MLAKTLDSHLTTLPPETAAGLKKAFLAASKAIGKQITANVPPGRTADRVQTWLDDQLAEIAQRLGSELHRPK